MNSKEHNSGSISFLDYKVLEASFNLNRDFNDTGAPINIDFKIGHGYEIFENEMQVGLGMKIFEDAKENNYPFEMKVSIQGLFTSEDENINLKDFLPNALAILFPYVRSLVSSYTANSNVQPLILPTINIVGYLNNSIIDEED